MTNLLITCDEKFTCPRCNYENKLTVLEIEDKAEKTKCLQCKVYFHRQPDRSHRFISADGKRIFLNNIPD